MKVFEVSKANKELSSWKDDGCQMTVDPIQSRRNIPKKLKMRIRYRYFTAVYGFLCMFMLNAQRVNIGVAILKMTKNSTNELFNKTEEDDDDDQVIKYFDWSPEIQGYVLAAGNLGYLILQLPAGRLAEEFGSKIVLLSGLLCTSLANVLSPCSARFDPICLIIVQFVKGLGMSAITPAMSCLMASWFPKQERRFVLSFVYSGMSVGAFVGGTVSGVLSELSVLDGWPLVFYVFGSAGCLLFVLLCIFMYEDPEVHPSISESEVKFILDGRMKSSCSEKLAVPWMKILFSVPSLALFYGCFGQFWMAFYFIGVHNLFLGNVVKFSIAENGTLTSVGFLIQGAVICMASYASDELHRIRNINLNSIRKGNNTLSCVSFSLCLLVVYFAGYDKTINAIFCIIALSLIGFGMPGSVTAPVEMTPNFAGTLTGINNSISCSSGFIVPLVAGYLTTADQSLSEWQNVFLINIAVALTSGAVFHLFGSAEVQSWNGGDHKTQNCQKSKVDDVQQDCLNKELPFSIHL